MPEENSTQLASLIISIIILIIVIVLIIIVCCNYNNSSSNSNMVQNPKLAAIVAANAYKKNNFSTCTPIESKYATAQCSGYCKSERCTINQKVGECAYYNGQFACKIDGIFPALG